MFLLKICDDFHGGEIDPTNPTYNNRSRGQIYLSLHRWPRFK